MVACHPRASLIDAVAANFLSNTRHVTCDVSHVMYLNLQEFGPWWKWMVFDALLKLIARALARRSQRLESIFEAVGWL